MACNIDLQADDQEEDYYDVWADYADYDNEDQLKNQVKGIQNRHRYLHRQNIFDRSNQVAVICYIVSHFQTMTTVGGINVSKYGTKRKDTEEDDQVFIINSQFLSSKYVSRSSSKMF